MDILTQIQTLNACHGISGQEGGVAQVLAEAARPFVDEITTDVMGNLICHKKGKGKRVMLAAHMDSIGLMVTHIEEKGFLRVGKVGGVPPAKVLHSPVRFQNGIRGVVVPDGSVKLKDLTVDDVLIDIGVTSREEAEKLVQVGDTAVYDLPAFSQGSRLVSPYLDDRIGCVTLLGVMERMKETENDLYFVFTVQEEVGLRGAKTAAWSVDPDYGLAVDVTSADDEPGSKHGASSLLGKGAAIKVMDGHIISHPEMVKKLTELAKAEDIPHQMDVLRSGGTDAGEIHKSRCGVVSGGVSIPCRYTHTPCEMVDREDVEACVALLTAFVESEL